MMLVGECRNLAEKDGLSNRQVYGYKEWKLRKARICMRPNIFIVKSDQHNARCLGVNGHLQVKTPNLDQLAREGVNFTHAFVQSPICTPSRMCYLTGQYAHNHGHFGLIEDACDDAPLPENLPSMMSVLKENGYRTGIVGHIHVRENWLKPYCDTYIDMHSENNAYEQYLDAKGILHLRDDETYEDYVQTLDSCASKLSFEDSYEGFCLQSLEHFLDDLHDQPFVFQIDTLHPHENWIPVKEFWDMYEGIDLELPPSADEDLTGKPPVQQQVRDLEKHGGYKWISEPKTYAAGRLRKLRGYYGCISQVDYALGLMRKVLRERGFADNTIVLYCSDHGDFALEHGFLEKAPGISYDAILRTPFIWHWAGGEFQMGANVTELVESVDVFPTLCSLAGIQLPDTADGKDISAMLRGDTTPLRDFVVAEFPLSRTIRTKEWKLCHRPQGMFKDNEDIGELYNVIADPWEMNNLYSDPKRHAIREHLRRTLFDWTQWTTKI